jgi:hypothetical protein
MELINKWCYSIDDETYEGMYESIDAAHGEAQSRIDDETDETENGEAREYSIGRCCHPMDKIENYLNNGNFGSRIAEQVDEQLYNVVGGDDQIIDISHEDSIELGKLVYNFLKEKAHFSMYGVNDVTKHEYIIGSNE